MLYRVFGFIASNKMPAEETEEREEGRGIMAVVKG
jgi:hypothetical protein